MLKSSSELRWQIIIMYNRMKVVHLYGKRIGIDVRRNIHNIIKFTYTFMFSIMEIFFTIGTWLLSKVRGGGDIIYLFIMKYSKTHLVDSILQGNAGSLDHFLSDAYVWRDLIRQHVFVLVNFGRLHQILLDAYNLKWKIR